MKRKQTAKPERDFPLFRHATGQWAKKIKGKLFYFGTDAETARQKYLDERDDLQAGRLPRRRQAGAVTVRDVVNDFLRFKESLVETGELSPRTFDQYLSAGRRFTEHFGGHRAMTDLRPEDFTAYRIVLAKRGGLYDQARNVRIARMICLHAQDQGLVETVIRFGKAFKEPSRKAIRKARQDNQARHGLRMFEADDLRRIIDKAGQPLQAMIYLAANCGFGATDCSSLPTSALDLAGGWVDFPRPKTATERRCPLWPETAAALREAIARRPDPADPADAHLAFLTRAGNRFVRSVHREAEDGKKTLVTFDRVAQEFAKLLKSLDLKRKGINFYAVRHTFQTIGEKSKDQTAIRAIMGHVDESMSERYREKIEDERLQAVVDVVREWLFARADEKQKPKNAGIAKSETRKTFSEAVAAVLADGEWYTIHQMVALVGMRVQPEVARRRTFRNGIDPKKQDVGEAIERGRKQVVRDRLARMRTIESRGTGANREYRLASAKRKPVVLKIADAS